MGIHTPILPHHLRAAIEGEIEMHLQRIDQSEGPVNHAQANRAYIAAAAGLVRSPTGGWQRA